jgi:hypothetical protein
MSQPFILSWACFLMMVTSIQAAGPSLVSPNGSPIRWGSQHIPVSYYVDQGNLGSLTNAEAVALVDLAFNAWQGVPTTSVRFQRAGTTTGDVTGANVVSFLNSQNPVLFDSDGSIVDALQGVGASSHILGYDFSFPFDTATATYRLHYLVINGRFASQLKSLTSTVLHEIGHLVGLDHSQLHQDFYDDSDSTNNDLVPIMFPIGLLRANPLGLTFDDQVSISTLYPNSNFQTDRGTISGTIYTSDGITPFQGANVIIEKIDDPRLTAATSVSGFLYLKNGNPLSVYGSSNPALKGFFEVKGLPPGQYRVKVESVNNWAQGSTVGPISFQNPLPGPPEYYSGSESNSDNPNDYTLINVTAGSNVSNRNVVLNNEFEYFSFIPLIIEDSGFRTNFGVNNLSNSSASVRYGVLAGGNLLGVNEVIVPPNGMTQVNRVAAGLGTTQAWILAISTKPFTTWASVIDNLTQDPALENGITISTKTNVMSGGVIGRRLLIPSSAKLGLFQSSLSILNLGGTTEQVTIKLYDQNGSLVNSMIVAVGSGQLYHLEDVRQQASGTFGPIEVLGSSPQAALVAVSRTYSNNGTSSFFTAVGYEE